MAKYLILVWCMGFPVQTLAAGQSNYGAQVEVAKVG